MSRALLTAILITLALGARAGDGKFPGIEKLMTPEEFRAAGLDQLDDAQLESLDAWLLRYTAGESAIIRQDKSIKEVQEAQEAFELVSRIEGDFSGWSGKTVFRLENGQVWRQRQSGRYVYVGPPNPEVRITKNWMGFYKLTLIEKDRGVGVSLVD
jgi:hypothetical protein